MKSDDCFMEVLCGGKTNSIYKVSLSSRLSKLCINKKLISVIVRIYGAGTELFIDRDWECFIFASLSSADLAPTFYGRFDNGRIEEYVDSTTLSPQLID